MPESEVPKLDVAQLRKDADALYADLVIGINKVLDVMPKTNTDKDAIIFVGRKFLFDSTVLCGEIIWALNEKRVYLGVIGAKTLLEILINTKYIFVHQCAKSDPKWVEKLCREYMDVYGTGENDWLNGKSVTERARSVPPEDALITYKGLCKIAHATKHTRHVVVGTEDTKNDFASDTYVVSLTATVNTLGYIATFFGVPPNNKFEIRVTELARKYPQRVK